MARNDGRNRGLIALIVNPEKFASDNPMWKPTELAPGSPGKMDLLTSRILAGLPMFHPDDRGTRDMRWHNEET